MHSKTVSKEKVHVNIIKTSFYKMFSVFNKLSKNTILLLM